MPRDRLPAASSRHVSMKAVVETIVQNGAVSRAGIARVTGLSKQTISDAVRELEEQGWLRPSGRSRGKLGRGATNYEMRNDAAFVLGCDLGGTKLHIALADLSGAIVAEAIEQTARKSSDALLAQIRATTERIIRKAKVDRRRVHLAAIGMPGVVDPNTGGLALSPNMPRFHATNIIDAMRRAFGCQVMIENDVNLAVLGEHWQGRGQGKRNLAFIAMGTGVGMGILSEGRLMRGSRGAAAEISYLPLGGDPFDRRNVESGTLESVIGTEGIILRNIAAGGARHNGVKALFRAMTEGDKIALRVIDDTAKYTALGIAAVVAICDPELVILGGGIGTRPEFIALVESHLGRCLLRPVAVAASALENRASLMGAIAMGLTNLYSTVFGSMSLPDAARQMGYGERNAELAAA